MRLLNKKDSVINNSVKKNDRIMTESLTEKEEKTMVAILNYLRDNNTISNEIGRDLTGKSEATVKRYLGRLCEIGLLEQIGATRNTIYRRNI